MNRRAALVLCLSAGALTLPAAAAEYELLFVERAGCAWCARFKAETMEGYALSDIGRAAPIRRANLDDGRLQGVVLAEPVRFTPTFVLLSGGREIARIVGYTDNATFYGLMEKHLAEARAKAMAAPKPEGRT
jgi:thioredoxin-related protein